MESCNETVLTNFSFIVLHSVRARKQKLSQAAYGGTNRLPYLIYTLYVAAMVAARPILTAADVLAPQFECP